MNATSDAIQRPRQSNIELLRIAAMLLILVLHANFFALGAYEPEDFKTDPLPTATRILFEQAAIYAVNLFVLISGWFGIRTKTKSLTALMFQYAFFSSCYSSCRDGLKPDRPQDCGRLSGRGSVSTPIGSFPPT